MRAPGTAGCQPKANKSRRILFDRVMKRKTSPDLEIREIFDPMQGSDLMRKNKVEGNCMLGICLHRLRMPLQDQEGDTGRNLDCCAKLSSTFYAAQLESLRKLSQGQTQAVD